MKAIILALIITMIPFAAWADCTSYIGPNGEYITCCCTVGVCSCY